jgi:hypothetical protein
LHPGPAQNRHRSDTSFVILLEHSELQNAIKHSKTRGLPPSALAVNLAYFERTSPDNTNREFSANENDMRIGSRSCIRSRRKDQTRGENSEILIHKKRGELRI